MSPKSTRRRFLGRAATGAVLAAASGAVSTQSDFAKKYGCEAVKNYTPCTAACQASLSFTISQSLLRLISIELVIPSNHLVLYCLLLLLRSIFPSIRVF